MNKIEWFLFIALIIVFLVLLNVTGVLYENNPDILKCTFKDLSTLLGVIISCVALIITAYFVVMAINAYGHIKEINEVKEKAENVNNLLEEITTKYNSIKEESEEVSNQSTEITAKYDEIKRKSEEVSNQSTEITAKYDEIRKKSEEVSNQSTEITAKFDEIRKKSEKVSDQSTEITAKYDEIKQNAEIINRILEDSRNKYTIIGNRIKSYEIKLKLYEYRSIYIYPFLLDEDSKMSYLINLAIWGEACDIIPIEKISKNNKESERIRRTAKEVVKELRRRFSDA